MFKSITSSQERDACLALAFLLLLIWLFCKLNGLVYAAMAVILAGMIWSPLMRPFAFLWFGLARVLGGVMSSALLSIVWVALVLPVGLVRRAMGRDSLRLKQWHDGKDSCFVVRERTFTAEDLKHPY